MWIWILAFILGICALGSLYMTFLAAKVGDSSGAWLFGSFGLLFGVLLFVIGIKALAKRKAFFKAIDERISGTSEPPRTGFVAHWFMMGAITLTVLLIVVSILIKVIR